MKTQIYFLISIFTSLLFLACSLSINDKKSCSSDDIKNACSAGYVCIAEECILDPKNIYGTITSDDNSDIHARTSKKTVDIRGGILYHSKGFQVIIPSNTLSLDETIEFSVEEFGKSVPYGDITPSTNGFIFQPIPYTFSSTISILFTMSEEQISLLKGHKLSLYHSNNPGDNGWETLPSFIYTSSLAANVLETGMYFVGESE